MYKVLIFLGVIYSFSLQAMQETPEWMMVKAHPVEVKLHSIGRICIVQGKTNHQSEKTPTVYVKRHNKEEPSQKIERFDVNEALVRVFSDYKSDNGENILHVLAGEKNKCMAYIQDIKDAVDVAKMFIAHGVNVDHITKEKKQSPLHYAILAGKEEFVTFFSNYTSLIDKQDCDGNTPLHLAVSKNDPFCLKRLLKNGARLDVYNNDGRTPRLLIIEKAKRITFESARESAAVKGILKLLCLYTTTQEALNEMLSFAQENVGEFIFSQEYTKNVVTYLRNYIKTMNKVVKSSTEQRAQRIIDTVLSEVKNAALEACETIPEENERILQQIIRKNGQFAQRKNLLLPSDYNFIVGLTEEDLKLSRDRDDIRNKEIEYKMIVLETKNPSKSSVELVSNTTQKRSRVTVGNISNKKQKTGTSSSRTLSKTI